MTLRGTSGNLLRPVSAAFQRVPYFKNSWCYPNGAGSTPVHSVPGVDPLTRLALAARDGDRSALDRLVEGSYEQVWRLCARLADEQSADDLAQDTFIRAVGALPKFRGEASARTWLLAIARNTCMDELRTRSRRRRRDSALVAGVAGRRDVVADAGQQIGVTDAVAQLGSERREAFVLTQLLGLSYQEAAEVCACPPGTIRSRVARARADLIDALEESGRDQAAADGAYDSVTSMYPIARHMTS
jgi:RNA polymerase sigma-70 factor, ECF subfamily